MHFYHLPTLLLLHHSFYIQYRQRIGRPHKMDASPLRKLPREFRDEVYRLALYQPESIEVFPPNESYLANPSGRRPKHPPWHRRVPNLTTVCKEIRAESLSIFYMINTFRFTVDPLRIYNGYGERESDMTEGWIKNIGPAACMSLRNVEIAVEPPTSLSYEYSSRPAAMEVGSSHNIIKATAKKALITLIIDISFMAEIIQCMPDELRLSFSDPVSEAIRVDRIFEEKDNHVKGLPLEKRPPTSAMYTFDDGRIWTSRFLGGLAKVVK